MYATCFYGILNTRTGELQYSNAGHNLPYRMRASGEVEELSNRGGTPLGLLPWKHEGGSTARDAGDPLFLNTDGVPEANNVAMEDFTDARLVEVLREAASMGSQDVIGLVSEKLLEFTAGAAQSDDITMVAVRRASSFVPAT